MDPTDLSDDQLDHLAQQLAGRLPTGTHGDRVVLSRRQALGAITGTIGTGALLALGVDPAVAQAAGQQGTASEPNDMFAYNLDVENGADFNGTDISGVGSLSTERVNGDYVYAGNFDGADADTRLDNALSAISAGGVLNLEAAAYGDAHTVSKDIKVAGPSATTQSARLGNTFTLDVNNIHLESVMVDTGTILANGADQILTSVRTGGASSTIEVAGDRVLISDIVGFGEIIFQNGSNGGLADSVVSVGVTDNGSNTIGDVV